jgi:hypothetical protein
LIGKNIAFKNIGKRRRSENSSATELNKIDKADDLKTAPFREDEKTY